VRAKNCPGCGCPVSSELLIIPKAIKWLEETCKNECETHAYPNKIVLKFADICGNELQEGDQYIGEIKDGVAHGVGVFSWSGNIYIGEFKNCYCDGFGRTIYASGSSYTGQYKKDKKHGYGKTDYPEDGIGYEGYYKDGERHGEGTQSWSSSNMTCRGTFKNDKQVGSAVVTRDGIASVITFDKDGNLIK